MWVSEKVSSGRFFEDEINLLDEDGNIIKKNNDKKDSNNLICDFFRRLKYAHVCGCGESFTPIKDIPADGKQKLGWN